jgi:hypothetical protein
LRAGTTVTLPGIRPVFYAIAGQGGFCFNNGNSTRAKALSTAPSGKALIQTPS